MELKRIRHIFLFLMLLCLSTPAQEKHEDDQESGFFGNIILGGGWMGGRPSQDEVASELSGDKPVNRKIDSLDDRADHQSYGIPVILGELGYAFSRTGTEISTSLEKSILSGVNLEIKQYLGDYGALSVGGSYARGDVWENPFLIGVDRDTTTVTEFGFDIDYTEIFGTGFQLSYGFENFDVEDDEIGDLNKELRRDGWKHTIGAGYALAFNQRNLWNPKLKVVNGDMEGESNSFLGIRAELDHFGGIGKFIFNTSLGYEERKYNKTHDVFEKTRKDQLYSLEEIITYVEPFGWRSWSFHGMLIYSGTQSNITFFDGTEIIFGLGVSYNF